MLDGLEKRQIRIRLRPEDRKAELLLTGARVAEHSGLFFSNHGLIAKHSTIHCSVPTVFNYFNDIAALRRELSEFILKAKDVETRYPRAAIEAYVYLSRLNETPIDEFLTKFSIRAYLDGKSHND